MEHTEELTTYFSSTGVEVGIVDGHSLALSGVVDSARLAEFETAVMALVPIMFIKRYKGEEGIKKIDYYVWHKAKAEGQ